MPRTGRIVLQDYPHHVVQRGHNRQVVFAEAADYERYLSDLRELKEALGVRVYGYCLMTNHVHLLLGPRRDLGALMKALAGRATRYRNRLEQRSGTLWESRYKSSLVQTDTYLLACCRYIELNPVRARMVGVPQDYAWSSARERLGLNDADVLDWHPTYLSLGRSAVDRQKRYAQFLKDAIPVGEWGLIRDSLQRGQLTGNARFVDEIERIIGKRVEHRGRGRPRKQSGEQAGSRGN